MLMVSIHVQLGAFFNISKKIVSYWIHDLSYYIFSLKAPPHQTLAYFVMIRNSISERRLKNVT